MAVVSYASPVTAREEMAILLDGNAHLLYGFTRASTEQGLWVSFTTARVNDDREVTFLGHDQSGGVVFRNGRPALKGLLNDFADVGRCSANRCFSTAC